MLDDELFQDGIHPSFRGQIALRRASCMSCTHSAAFDWPRDSPPPLIDPAQCAAHFGLGPAEWRMVCLRGILFYDLTYSIRYDPSHRLGMKRRYAAAADQIEAGAAPESVGLPNVGIPPAIPVIPFADTERRRLSLVESTRISRG